MKPVRMVVFDLDGTLITGKSSWRKIHEFFGTEQKGDAALARYERGEIDYREFMRRDMSAWPTGISVKIFQRVLSEYKLSEGAVECVQGLRKRAVKIGVISSGIDMLVKQVCDRLGLNSYVANGFEFDSAGRLTGGVLARVDLYRKDEVLRTLVGEHGFETDEVLGVGDTRFDSTFLQACGYRVAFRPRDADRKVLEAVAHYFIDDLRELLPILDDIRELSARGEQERQKS